MCGLFRPFAHGPPKRQEAFRWVKIGSVTGAEICVDAWGVGFDFDSGGDALSERGAQHRHGLPFRQVAVQRHGPQGAVWRGAGGGLGGRRSGQPVHTQTTDEPTPRLAMELMM